MNEANWIGALAEAAVIAKLTEHQFHVFNQVTGKAPFDLVASKGNRLWRVSVKGTARPPNRYGSYAISLCRMRYNCQRSIKHLFEAKSCDIVAVYIHNIRKVCFIKSSSIKAKQGVGLRIKRTVFCKRAFLISDFEVPDF